MGALLLGDLADRDRALAEAREGGRGEGATDARRAGAEALDAVRREHALALAAAAEQEQATADTAYHRGLAEAATNWQARAKRAEANVAQWNASTEALWAWRARLDDLVDRVLAYLDDRETGPWAASEHRRYLALVHDLRRSIDHCLEVDLEGVMARGR